MSTPALNYSFSLKISPGCTPCSAKHQFRGMIPRAWEAGSSSVLPQGWRSGPLCSFPLSPKYSGLVLAAESTAEVVAQPGQDPEQEVISPPEARKRRYHLTASDRRETGTLSRHPAWSGGWEYCCNAATGTLGLAEAGSRHLDLLRAGSEKGGACPAPADTRRP